MPAFKLGNVPANAFKLGNVPANKRPWTPERLAERRLRRASRARARYHATEKFDPDYVQRRGATRARTRAANIAAGFNSKGKPRFVSRLISTTTPVPAAGRAQARLVGTMRASASGSWRPRQAEVFPCPVTRIG